MSFYYNAINRAGLLKSVKNKELADRFKAKNLSLIELNKLANEFISDVANNTYA